MSEDQTTLPPDQEGLARLLDEIAIHDWRVSILAHTSDTAREAADALRSATRRIVKLEAERDRWSDTAGDWMERAVQAEAKLRTWETKVAAALSGEGVKP